MYGGLAHGTYIESFINLTSFLSANNIPFNYEFLYNESLIQRGRNTLVDVFMKSDCDVFLFIDADIGFDWYSVIQMLDIMATQEDKKILCGVCPKKDIAWEKLYNAHKHNFIKNPMDAIKYSNFYVLNYDAEEGENVTFKGNEPVKIKDGGTGFMMIHKEVFEAFKKKYPEQASIHPNNKTDLFYYFDCKIDPKTKIYLSEDYMFCQYAKKIGYVTWALPWLNFTHSGSYTFRGNFLEDAKMYYEINNLSENPTVEE
jgi:hypothetical protein